jgi:hypothetical protein
MCRRSICRSITLVRQDDLGRSREPYENKLIFAAERTMCSESVCILLEIEYCVVTRGANNMPQQCLHSAFGIPETAPELEIRQGGCWIEICETVRHSLLSHAYFETSLSNHLVQTSNQPLFDKEPPVITDPSPCFIPLQALYQSIMPIT